jgi:hypothetical protein
MSGELEMSDLPERFKNRGESRRQIADAVTAGLGGAAPPTLSIAGNAFTLIDSSGEQEAVETKYIDVVIADVNEKVPVQRVYFGVGNRYDANNPQAPLCFSDNGIGASSNAREPQSTDCKTCPMSKWDSDVSPMTGKGVPACKIVKKLAVLPLDGDTPLYNFPFQLRVPVMSHAALQAYGNKFRGQQFDVSDVVTRISFAHGKVGQLEFEARKQSPWATDEVDALVNKILDSKVTDSLVGRNDVPIQGQLAAPTQPSAQLVPAPSIAAAVEAAEPKKPGRPKKLVSKPAESAPALPSQEAKPAPVAAARPLPSFLQPQKGDPPQVGQGETKQPVAAPSQAPSELQAALERAFNLKL